MAKQPWFESWFDSPYYHILYKNRSYIEAAAFLNQLVEYLSPTENATMLDVGCGNGRHSLHLAKKGFPVVGVDLSANNVEIAKARAIELNLPNAAFKIGDMRKKVGQQFDYVFNLFTSFGYFEKEEDNLEVIQAFKSSLKKEGTVVIDFLNAPYVINNLVEEEQKLLEGVDFKIRRKIDTGYVVKEIHFQVADCKYNFEEKVQLLQLDDFKRYFKQVGFTIDKVFGNYQLEQYNPETSNRLVMIIKALG